MTEEQVFCRSCKACGSVKWVKDSDNNPWNKFICNDCKGGIDKIEKYIN